MRKIKIDLLPYQMRILKSDKPFLALIGGTGCGKTFFLPRWLFIKTSQYPGNDWIVSAPTIPMLKRNPWKYCLKFFQESDIKVETNKTEMVMYIPSTDSRIYFISAENPDRMQGIHAKGIIGDEAGLFSRVWWDVAVQRVAYQKGQILLLTTPYAENWLKTEVWDKWISGHPDFYVENPSSIDNPFYPRAEYERAKKTLPDWKFKMFFEGKFTKPMGLIYPEYETVEPFDIPPSWFIFGGVDFGFNNPFAVVWIAENPSTGEYCIFDEFKKPGLVLDMMESVLKKRKCVYYADPEAKEIIESLKTKGIDIRPAKKDVLPGIAYVQSLFKQKRLKIFKGLNFLLDEINTYQWEMDKSENFLDKPRKENDHLMDAMRYALYTVQKTDKPIWAKPLGIERVTSRIFGR